jgi:hypothetical protein
MALDCAEDPSAVICPAGQDRAGPVPVAELPVVAVVELEQAARERVLRAATAASFDTRVMLTIILQSG